MLNAPDVRKDADDPPRTHRIIAALCIATLASAITEYQYLQHMGYHSDFGLAWFGASSLIHHIDPYPLVGPGRFYEWHWPLLYPATTLVAVLPFVFLSEQAASVTFVWLSTFLLAYGMTRHNSHLLPLFVSYSFVSSAWLAQWSILFTAALFTPWLGFLSAAKPQAAIPVLAHSRSAATLKAAAIGGIFLFCASLVLLPAWLGEWLPLVRAAQGLQPPITRLGGILVLLLLFRWRRREAWLVLSMALMPATWGWYNVLILLTIPATFGGACLLSFLSTAGAVFGPYMIPGVRTAAEFDRFAGAVLVASAYLPAVIMVLRRPNEGELPAWLSMVATSITSWSKRGGSHGSDSDSAR